MPNRIDFDDGSYITVAAKNADNINETIVNAAEISISQLEELLGNIIDNSIKVADKPAKKKSSRSKKKTLKKTKKKPSPTKDGYEESP